MTGEHLAPDIRALVQLLHHHRVRYLLVGAEAVIHHGSARLTGDVDFFFEPTSANARRLCAALVEFWGGAVPAVGFAEELIEPDVIVQFGRPPNRSVRRDNRVDLLNRLGTLSFARAWSRRVRETLCAKEGAVPLPVIGPTRPDPEQARRRPPQGPRRRRAPRGDRAPPAPPLTRASTGNRAAPLHARRPLRDARLQTILRSPR